ncbi:hypothetical protein Hbor_35340 (plasmid) [Halogeometricum borinquense DSM 11551]|uniref:Uncharacterized protein n=1 Tax=Halogeometricum borinquense (strain ATCC 700274 / DSM 11551 / JCM 10706 / KCTC 4070 / PR3) TaxID=469382 RepID=E4NV65_HALBP|nr:hypothetical protein Hbor_35340 [Halogeometricum borinquense DSM 11551]
MVVGIRVQTLRGREQLIRNSIVGVFRNKPQLTFSTCAWVFTHTVAVYASLNVKNVKKVKKEAKSSRSVARRDDWLESQAIEPIPEDIVLSL